MSSENTTERLEKRKQWLMHRIELALEMVSLQERKAELISSKNKDHLEAKISRAMASVYRGEIDEAKREIDILVGTSPETATKSP